MAARPLGTRCRSAHRHVTVVAYDVADDRRRRRIAGLLEDAGGIRVNWSVFEVEIELVEKRRLQRAIARAMDPCTDAVRYYPLCGRCERAVEAQGIERTERKPLCCAI